MTTRRKVESHRPAKTYTVRGEYDTLELLDGDNWRTPTDQEREHIETEEYAKLIYEREILTCQSSLVDDLLKLAAESTGDLAKSFAYDEIENVYPDPEDWTAEQCREWMDDIGVSYPDDSNPFSMGREELADELESLGHEVRNDERQEALALALFASLDAGDWGDVDDWREQVRDNAEPAEILEWWLVDSYLAGNLADLGYCVLRNDYGNWWGRTTSGQGILADGVIQHVAALRNRRLKEATSR